MGNKTAELIDILEKEISLYEESLDMVTLEKDAMGKYFLEGILDCQKSRMALNLQINELEEKRSKLTGEMASDMGIPFEALTLKDIIREARGYEKERLEQCSLTFNDLLETLSDALKDNKRIALSSLSFVDSSIKVLSGYNVDQPTYLSSGIMENHDCPPNRVMKEV